jgi:hypothetical protein
MRDMDGCLAMMNVEVTVHGLVSPRFGSEQISLLIRALHRLRQVQDNAYNPSARCRRAFATGLCCCGRKLCMKSAMHLMRRI